MNITKYVAAAGGLAAGILVAAGVAVADTPAADGSITACVDASGMPRIIDTDAGESCGGDEERVSWTSAWTPRGWYRADRAYEVGDLVNARRTCGGITGWDPNSTWTLVRVRDVPDRGCPFADPFVQGDDRGWEVVTPGTRILAYDSVDGFRVGANDTDVLVSSDRNGNPVRAWNYGDVIWINKKNAEHCQVDATPVADTAVTVTRATWKYADWIALLPKQSGQPVRVPMDVVLTCAFGA